MYHDGDSVYVHGIHLDSHGNAHCHWLAHGFHWRRVFHGYMGGKEYSQNLFHGFRCCLLGLDDGLDLWRLLAHCAFQSIFFECHAIITCMINPKTLVVGGTYTYKNHRLKKNETCIYIEKIYDKLGEESEFEFFYKFYFIEEKEIVYLNILDHFEDLYPFV
jgi:hypothetical protein